MDSQQRTVTPDRPYPTDEQVIAAREVMLDRYKEILRECARINRWDEDAVDEKGVAPVEVIAVVGLDGTWLGRRCAQYGAAITLRRHGVVMAMVVDFGESTLEEPTNSKRLMYRWCEDILHRTRRDRLSDYRWQQYHEEWDIDYPPGNYPDRPDAHLGAVDARLPSKSGEAGHA